MNSQYGQNILVWSWRYFNKDIVRHHTKTKVKEAKNNVIMSLLIAFVIIIISAQLLGLINNFFIQEQMQLKYQDMSVLLYSARC